MVRNKRLVTARDVARTAGVSQATVSYILGGRAGGEARISIETRQRVLDAVAALGYVPNQTARSLRRQRTERLCVVLPVLGVPSNDLLLDHLQQEAEAHAYSVIVTIGGSMHREAHVVDLLRRGLADGAVLIEPSYITSDDLVPLVRANLALVVMSNRISVEGLDVVRIASEAASYEAVSYLLARGHERIAFLGHCGATSSRVERLAGYRRAMQTGGIEPDPELVRGSSNSREAAYADTRTLLQLPERPTAIFAASDMAAIRAIWAIRDAGLRIPDDVAVVGAGNIPEGEMTRPALTTIGLAQPGFGDIADLLFTRLRGNAPSSGRVLDQHWTLIMRGSA